MPNKHARLSPSGASKWMGCPPSLAAERGIPETRSEHAAEGTAAHAVAEAVLKALNPRWKGTRPQFSKVSAAEYVGETIENWLITDDMAPPIQTYIDTILAAARGKVLHVEQRVDFSHVVGVRNSFGTADAVIIDGEELQIHDLKFGRGVRVDAENNFQLMIYALGALRLFDLGIEFSTVKLFIHQPRLNHISEWSITVQELKKFARTVKKAAKVAMGYFELAEQGKAIPPEAFTPSEKACRWCKASPTCAAYTRFVYQAVVDQFAELDATITEAPDPTKLTPEQLARALDNADFIEGWVMKIRAESLRRLTDGVNLPGYTLGKGRPGNRKWADPETVGALLARHASNDEIYTPPALISPATAEKLFKDRPEVWEEVAPLITRAPGAPVAVRGTLADEFEAIQ